MEKKEILTRCSSRKILSVLHRREGPGGLFSAIPKLLEPDSRGLIGFVANQVIGAMGVATLGINKILLAAQVFRLIAGKWSGGRRLWKENRGGERTLALKILQQHRRRLDVSFRATRYDRRFQSL